MEKRYTGLVTLPTKSLDPELAGVTYTLRKFTHGTRTALRRELSKMLHKIREVTTRIDVEIAQHNLFKDDPVDDGQGSLIGIMLDAAPEGKKYTPEQKMALERISDYNKEMDLISNESIDPAYLRFGFHSIAGILDEEGDVFTAETLYQSGPEGLCQEIIREIKKLAGIDNGEIRENLELPTTSGGAADGQMKVTTVPPVTEITGT